MVQKIGQVSGLITYTYNDPLYRLTSVQKTNGGTNTFSYNTGTSHPWSITTTSEIDTSHTSNSVAYQDGLGRTYETLLTSDLYGSDEVDTIYDKLGQVYSVSNPHRSTSSPTDGTTVLNSYDAIGRLLELTLPNGDIIHRSYTKRSTFWSAENFSAPRFYQTDDLGRLTSVCERSTVTQANGAAPVTPCNSDYPTYPGFMTSYTYDPLNRLTQVNQSGQIRQFFYDGLSRLTEEVNPETGPKYYTYDTQNAGDLYQRTAGEPNHTAWTGSLTTYTHDVLHRLTNITYGDPYTNPVTFYWDVSSWLTGKQKGRMVRQDNTGVGGCGAPCAGEEYSYDIDGNVVEKNSWTPSNWNSGPTLLSYYAYNYLDQQTSMIDIWGTTYTTSYDAADRPTSLASSLSNSTHPPTLYTVNSYNPLGEITSSTYGHTGSGMTATAHTASYDNRGRLLTINDAVTGGSPYSLSLAYTNGLVTSANDSVNGNWSTFTYDAFNRLWTSWCSANCPNGTNAEGYDYTYDQFGNRWTQTLAPGSGPGFPASYNFDGNNHLTPTNCTNGPGNFCYDGAGNLEYDGLGGNWAHDAEGRVFVYETSSVTDSYTYDGMGQRVQRAVGGTTYDYVFDNEGHENTKSYGGFTTTNWSNLYFGGTRVSTYANGTTYFSHNDYLGTPRTQTDPTGNTDGSAYTNGPWGEGGSNALPGDLGFTGDLFDNPDGEVFHTPNRKYSPMQGRWMIPDPAGVAAVDVANPQSWNRYAYVLNNPVSLIDPLGLYCFYGGDGDTPENDSDPTDYDFGATSSDDCGDGGQWIDTSTQVTVNGDSPDDPGVTIENGQQVFPEVVGLQPSFGDCVKNSGNYFSLQNMLGLGDAKGAAGFLAGAALGNPVSDAIAFGQGLADHNASAAGGSGASAAIGLVDPDGQALDAASHLQDVTVAATSVSVTTVQAPGASVTVVSVDTASLTIPLGTLASIAKPLATAAKGANIWNYGVSAVSAMICGIGR